MKIAHFIPTLLLLLVFNACGSLSDEQIINRTVNKLNSIRTIEYVGHIDKKIGGTKLQGQAVCFFDFRSSDSFLGAKYIIDLEVEHFSQVTYFDGKSFTRIDRNRREIIKNDNPLFYHVSSDPFVTYSIAKLRQVLPLIQNDPAVTFTRLNDTIINSIASYYFKIEMKGKAIGIESILHHFTNESIARYHLAIDKSTFLPIQFEEWLGAYQHIKVTFSQIRLNQIKDDSIWRGYENFPEYYLRMSHQDWVQSIRNSGRAQIGVQAIEWTLPDLQGNLINLSDLRGSNTLLMFFFPGCQACIPAISILNNLNEKYAHRGLKILGIEFSNASNTRIEAYIREREITFPILLNGREVASQYGIRGAPTFVLIDPSGSIIYNQVGLHNREELIKSVERLF